MGLGRKARRWKLCKHDSESSEVEVECTEIVEIYDVDKPNKVFVPANITTPTENARLGKPAQYLPRSATLNRTTGSLWDALDVQHMPSQSA
jgi:hypothetical protein